jgi:hypothetical protein
MSDQSAGYQIQFNTAATSEPAVGPVNNYSSVVRDDRDLR